MRMHACEGLLHEMFPMFSLRMRCNARLVAFESLGFAIRPLHFLHPLWRVNTVYGTQYSFTHA